MGKIRKVVAAGVAIVFLSACVGLAFSLGEGWKEEKVFQDLQQTVRQETDSAVSEDFLEEREEEEPGILPQYQSLFEENPDLAGWIRIEGTAIDYPVMMTPEDPEYYLRRDFYGEKSVSGVPFIGAGCTLNPRSDHVVIYGHNMDNGTMFHDLLNFSEEEYWKEHPTIQFDTLEKEGTYEILAAFYTQIYPEDRTDVFRYYQVIDLSDPDLFLWFLENIEGAALYETGVSAQYGDRFLTLSTCSYHVEEGRFVVVAREK